VTPTAATADCLARALALKNKKIVLTSRGVIQRPHPNGQLPTATANCQLPNTNRHPPTIGHLPPATCQPPQALHAEKKNRDVTGV
jgi:hypothetical protein